MAAVLSIGAVASRALEHDRQVREAALISNETLIASRLAALKDRKRNAVPFQRAVNKRLARAVRGVVLLSDACTSPEVQTLINARGGLSLWSARIRLGGEGGPIEYFFGMRLMAEGILIYDQTFYGDMPYSPESMMFFLPYHGDSFICHLRLARIASPRGCNPHVETKRFESLDGNNEDPTNILFQILADCAEPRMLRRYLIKAIKP